MISVTIPEGCRHILAAVSGGADSVALLHLLKRAAEERNVKLSCATFDHGIRGEEAAEDVRFVCELCKAWDIPCHAGAADVPTLAKNEGLGLESAARKARYDFLYRLKDEVNADCIALAHHLDDQAETVLMHILRGSSLKGACGMKMSDGVLLRPLLSYRKSELTEYLIENHIPWREDSTNREADNPRNILRLKAMPMLEEAYPAAARSLGRFAELCGVENDYMELQTEGFLSEFCEETPTGKRIRKTQIHRAILLRALHKLTGLDSGECMRLERLYGSDRGTEQFPDGLTAKRTGEYLYLICRSFCLTEEIPVTDGMCVAIEGIGTLTAKNCAAEAIWDEKTAQVLDRKAVEGAVIRTRRSGDVIRPLNMPGDMKLKDYLIKQKVDEPMRSCTLLLAKDSDVLWVIGTGISDKAKLTEGSEGIRIELKKERK